MPSGDRRMARSFVELLAGLGHEVELACHFRSYDRNGDRGAGSSAWQRSAQRWPRGCCGAIGAAARRPQLWFTYHLYHKAPDWLGPAGQPARWPSPMSWPRRSIAAQAGRRALGRWPRGEPGGDRPGRPRAGDDASRSAGLAGAVAVAGKTRLFPPFLDAAPFVAAASTRAAARAARGRVAPRCRAAVAAGGRDDAGRCQGALLPAARPGVGRLDRSALAAAHRRRRRGARARLRLCSRRFGDRVRLLGALPAAALPSVYAAADLYVWPACNEAYGMALLEAQAAGVPVVAGAEGGVADVVVMAPPGCSSRRANRRPWRPPCVRC